MTPARYRPSAHRDLINHTPYYRRQGGDALGERFFAAALDAIKSIERAPGLGSPTIGERCDVPGLRARRTVGFPYHWYYFGHPDHLEVVRLLADAQDLAMILGDIDPDDE